MFRSEIYEVISNYLEIVDGEPSSVASREELLVPCLDRLAIIANKPMPDDCGSGVEAPRRDYNALYKEVGPKFKKCGLYQAGSLDLGESLVGDAIDDICDIAIDLSEVKWLWENAGKKDAIWKFHWGWHEHWGFHLRSLQWYLHEAERPG